MRLWKNKGTLLAVFAFLILSLVIWSCSDENFTIGEEFIESGTNVVTIDTFSLNLSTYKYDSVRTSGQDVVLCGKVKDSYFGNTSCTSYLQVKLPDTYPTTTDVLDSATLILTFNGQSYGDTTNRQTIYVHRVNQRIKANEDGNLYNTSHFSYDPVPIGSKTFLPWPKLIDSINVRLDDEFAHELYYNLVYKTEVTTSNDEFLVYLKGLAIVPDNNNTAVMGYSTDQSKLMIRFYTHAVSSKDSKLDYDLLVTNTSLQFNQITTDWNSGELKNYIKSGDDISSHISDNKTFVMGGMGLLTKIMFPSLQEIVVSRRKKVIKAELLIKPALPSYNYRSLPPRLVLYKIDKLKQIFTYSQSTDSSAFTASLVSDNLYHENTYYNFDVTTFVESELSDSYFDSTTGLLISLPSSKFSSSLEKLIIAAKDPTPKLKVTMISY